MYNALMKRRFMDEKHDYAIQAIFNFTSVFEDRAGQDLGVSPKGNCATC